MSTTPDLGIPYVSQQQAQPEVSHNEAILMMSATLIGVISIGDNTPPASPQDGDNYVIGSAPTGDWSGRANCVAIRSAGGWRFVPDRDSAGTIITMGARQEGLKVYNKSTKAYSAWDGTAWIDLASVPGSPMEFGQRAISLNNTPVAVTAAVDSTLATNSDYVQVTGIYEPVPDGNNFGITQQTDSFTVTRTGFYRIEFWANATASVNNTQIAFKFAVNGTISLERRPAIYVRNASEVHSGSAFGYAFFNAGDVVTLWIASTNTANITIEDAVFGAHSLTNGPTDGELYGAELLNQLNDVEIDSNLSDGQFIAWDEVNQVYINSNELKNYKEKNGTAADGSISILDGSIQDYTLTANESLTFDLMAGQSLTLHLNAGDTYTVTWPTITWVGGSAPTLTSADVLTFWYFNGTLFGSYVGSVA